MRSGFLARHIIMYLPIENLIPQPIFFIIFQIPNCRKPTFTVTLRAKYGHDKFSLIWLIRLILIDCSKHFFGFLPDGRSLKLEIYFGNKKARLVGSGLCIFVKLLHFKIQQSRLYKLSVCSFS